MAAVIPDRCFTGGFEGLPGAPVWIAVGGAEQGWIAFERSTDSSMAFRAAPIAADDLLLLYFTSGTTAKPKLVAHSRQATRGTLVYRFLDRPQARRCASEPEFTGVGEACSHPA